jgi:outer membrane protein assembly factor BamB
MHRTSANQVLVSAFNGRVFGLESSTGAIRWERNLEWADEVEIAVEDGIVIAATGKRLAFLDLATGNPHAIVDIPGDYTGRATMVIQGGHIYVGRAGTISCMTIRGQPVWTQGFEGRGFGSVALGFAGNVRQGDDQGAK